MVNNSRDFSRKKLTDHTGLTGNSLITEQPISVFSWELSKAILELDSNLSIAIYYIGTMRDIPLLIAPPQETEINWKIYNLPIERGASLEIPEEIQQHIVPLPRKSYFHFFKEQMVNLLFKGSINNLFEKHGREIEPEIVKKTYSF